MNDILLFINKFLISYVFFLIFQLLNFNFLSLNFRYLLFAFSTDQLRFQIITRCKTLKQIMNDTSILKFAKHISVFITGLTFYRFDTLLFMFKFYVCYCPTFCLFKFLSVGENTFYNRRVYNFYILKNFFTIEIIIFVLYTFCLSNV